ncbi:hypothetical protein CRE_21477 [Caenorhabditis remanei]|uniref:Uncharacterized protein n=1 Tax=Caenorhabditis remanei TaxID=31234 RepID=E3N8X1_CAERE|nr:hypothetical protein CRE_21477 [Caenorhabditis remanei]
MRLLYCALLLSIVIKYVDPDNNDTDATEPKVLKNFFHSRDPTAGSNPSILHPRARHSTDPSSFRPRMPSYLVNSPLLSKRDKRNGEYSDLAENEKVTRK